jgi:hypothetical protein
MKEKKRHIEKDILFKIIANRIYINDRPIVSKSEEQIYVYI